jgi:hypothetical protein
MGMVTPGSSTAVAAPATAERGTIAVERLPLPAPPRVGAATPARLGAGAGTASPGAYIGR